MGRCRPDLSPDRGRSRDRGCDRRGARRIFRRRSVTGVDFRRHPAGVHRPIELRQDALWHRLCPPEQGQGHHRGAGAAWSRDADACASRRAGNPVRSSCRRQTGAAVNLGLSGRLTKATITSPLTPLFLIAALVVGLIAVVVIPREEEPQISVPMVDIRVNSDGLRGPDAVELVTKPLEAIVKGIDGVEHVYSQTEDDRVMVTARFLVGTKSDDAILRVHEKIRANLDRIPVGIPEPLIVGRGINDVAVSVLTLSPKPQAADRWTDKDLYELADKLRSELVKVDNIGLTYISGGAAQEIRV